MMASARTSKTPRRTSRVALNTNMIALRQADPATNASKRSSQAWKTSDNLRNSSMPSDHAVTTVNSAPKRTGITRIMAVVRSLSQDRSFFKPHALEDHAELDTVFGRNVDLVNQHPDGGFGIHREPVRRNRLVKMLHSGGSVVDSIQRLA